MKFLLILIALMLPNIAIADNEYYNANPKWESEFNINKNVNVKSINYLRPYQVEIVKTTYELAEKKFFKFWGLNHKLCKFQPLEIKIVRSHQELDNREYFPNERVYADKPGEGTEIIFGRYFKVNNILFIIPVNLSKYYWKNNFAHELLHYFFDECKVRFTNVEIEHENIDKFMKEYSAFFY